VTCGDEAVGDTAPTSELMMKVHRAITATTANHPGLAVRSVQATPGWGDIVFVRVQARMPGARSAQEAVEHALHAAVRDALDGKRSAVSVTWSG
jgi:hypothetical protein